MIYLELLWTFMKIGMFTIGGGYAMLPLIQEAVIEKGWMEPTQIVNFIAVAESTPGPFAINTATYVGMQMGGLLGALCATMGMVLPSFVIILVIARFFEKFKDNKIVEWVMAGLKPAVIGLIATAVLSIGNTALFPKGIALGNILSYDFVCILVNLAVTLYLIFKRKCHPIVVILTSAFIGIAAGYLPMIF